MLAFVASACASNVQQYTAVDLSERSMTVPPGGAGLTGHVKRLLAEAGWELVIYEGPRVTRGQLGPNTNLETSDTFNSRYNLIINWRAIDLCINLQRQISYDISLIDNTTGAEAITMSGVGCERNIASMFVDQVERR